MKCMIYAWLKILLLVSRVQSGLYVYEDQTRWVGLTQNTHGFDFGSYSPQEGKYIYRYSLKDQMVLQSVELSF